MYASSVHYLCGLTVVYEISPSSNLASRDNESLKHSVFSIHVIPVCHLIIQFYIMHITAHPCSDQLVTGPFGVPDSQITASSAQTDAGPERGRLNTTATGTLLGAWMPTTNNKSEYIQVNTQHHIDGCYRVSLPIVILPSVVSLFSETSPMPTLKEK